MFICYRVKLVILSQNDATDMPMPYAPCLSPRPSGIPGWLGHLEQPVPSGLKGDVAYLEDLPEQNCFSWCTWTI